MDSDNNTLEFLKKINSIEYLVSTNFDLIEKFPSKVFQKGVYNEKRNMLYSLKFESSDANNITYLIIENEKSDSEEKLNCKLVITMEKISIINQWGKTLEFIANKNCNDNFVNILAPRRFTHQLYWYSLSDFAKSRYNIQKKQYYNTKITCYCDNYILKIKHGLPGRNTYQEQYNVPTIEYDNEHKNFVQKFALKRVIYLRYTSQSYESVNLICSRSFNENIKALNCKERELDTPFSTFLNRTDTFVNFIYNDDFSKLINTVLGKTPEYNDVKKLENTLRFKKTIEIPRFISLIEKTLGNKTINNDNKKKRLVNVIKLSQYLQTCDSFDQNIKQNNSGIKLENNFDVYYLYLRLKNESIYNNCIREVCNIANQKMRKNSHTETINYAFESARNFIFKSARERKGQMLVNTTINNFCKSSCIVMIFLAATLKISVLNEEEKTSLKLTLSDIRMMEQDEFMTKHNNLDNQILQLVELLYGMSLCERIMFLNYLII